MLMMLIIHSEDDDWFHGLNNCYFSDLSSILFELVSITDIITDVVC